MTVISGNYYNTPHDASKFTVRDAAPATGPSLTASTDSGEFETLVFRNVTVDSGLLQIDMEYDGTSSGWTAVINGLDIRPMTAVGEITLAQ